MARENSNLPLLSLFQLSLAWSHINNSNDDNHDVSANDFVFDINPSLLVDTDKLTIDETIGEGSYSLVHKGWYENRPVAIKAIQPENTNDATPECKAKFQKEVNLLSRIHHKNIVKFIGACVEPSMMIITELLEGGSLQKKMSSTYPMTLDLEQCLVFALDISHAMEYLHANGIIHRDLKPGNLLLTKDKRHVKLADFGIARADICDEMTCEAGTYRYMAPELLSKDSLPRGAKIRYDRKADVFSFGMVLWAMIKTEIPFRERNNMAAAYATVNNKRPSVEEFPDYVIPLLKSCWEEDPKLRPEFKEITKTLKVLLKKCVVAGKAPAGIPKIEGLDGDHSNNGSDGDQEEEEDGGRRSVDSWIMEEILKHDDDHGIGTEAEEPPAAAAAATEGEAPESQSSRRALTGKAKKKSKLKRLLNRLLSCFAMPVE